MVSENIGMESGEHEVSPQDEFGQNETSPDQIFHGGSTLSDGREEERGTGRVMTPEETAGVRSHNLKEGKDWREQA